MRFVPPSAALVPVFLALSACGGGAEEAPVPEAEVTAAPTAAASVAPGATPTPGETPAPGATPSETARPTPAPTPRASATVAAAAKPPEFAVCAACHSTEPGKNGIGPTLAGVFGARAGHIASFDYSEQMESSGLTWNQGNLDRFLADPNGVIPGTKMAYPGLKDAAKRRAMIEYLKTL